MQTVLILLSSINGWPVLARASRHYKWFFEACDAWGSTWAVVCIDFCAVFSSLSQQRRILITMQTFKGRVTGVKVKAVDTTGAGDSFVAGFLFKLAADINLHEVIYCDWLVFLVISANRTLINELQYFLVIYNHNYKCLYFAGLFSKFVKRNLIQSFNASASGKKRKRNTCL